MWTLEFRDKHMTIEGYVNAVERYSKELREHGKKFTEKIKAGAFKKALERNKNVKLLFNHNQERVLANQEDNTLELTEDSIGLRAKATIRDEIVIEDAKAGRLTGWSFGFTCLSDSWKNDTRRIVNDLYLHEVSLLNVEPAYIGTSVEVRRADDTVITEVRVYTEEQTTVKDTEEQTAKKDTEENKDIDALERYIQLQKLFYI